MKRRLVLKSAPFSERSITDSIIQNLYYTGIRQIPEVGEYWKERKTKTKKEEWEKRRTMRRLISSLLFPQDFPWHRERKNKKPIVEHCSIKYSKIESILQISNTVPSLLYIIPLSLIQISVDQGFFSDVVFRHPWACGRISSPFKKSPKRGKIPLLTGFSAPDFACFRCPCTQAFF